MVKGYRLELMSSPSQKSPGNQGPSLNRRRDREACDQRCSEGLPLHRTIPQPDFPSPQKRWVSKAGDQLETVESIHTPSIFQDGESWDYERPAKERQLDGLSRSKRCLPVSHNTGGPLEIPKISMAGQCIRIQCLPFGLSSAPHVFTKLLKPVLVRLCHQGMRLIMYLDDMLALAQNKEELVSHLSQITSLLGYVVNREKSQLVPIQYLGFMVDSKEMKIRLSE